MSMTKERPILFSGPMVSAILEGRKTMARRIMKVQPCQRPVFQDWTNDGSGTTWTDKESIFSCPYGRPGHRLWVRESWSPDHAAFYPNFPVVYAADGDPRGHMDLDKPRVYSPEAKSWYPFRWRPSIHMPRAMSRITLEVTRVRAERLQDITREDAKAEGIPEYIDGVSEREADEFRNRSTVENFHELWNTINGPESWAANPWVWVVEFTKVASP